MSKRKGLLAWTRDGDQWVARGTIGEYRITPWSLAGGADYFVTVKRPSATSKTQVGASSSLARAKRLAAEYDAYRAS